MINPFFCYIDEEQELIIKINGEVKFSAFGTWWGVTKDNIECELSKKECVKIELNLTELLYMPILAMMRIVIFIKRISDIKEIKVKVKLYDTFSDNQERYYCYLESTGLLYAMAVIGWSISLDEKKIEVQNYNFDNDFIIPPRIIDCNKIPDLYLFIETLFKQKESKQFISNEEKYKILTILYELIDNVNTHAYDDDKKYIGVYVKLERGYLNSKNHINKIIYKNDFENMWGIDSELYINNETFFEIGVLDEGVGITSSMNLRNTDNSITKNVFFHSFERAFINGKRKVNDSTGIKSFYSGLNLINKVLVKNNDMIIAYEGSNWVKMRCKLTQNEIRHRNLSEEITKFPGLGYMIYLNREKKINYDSLSYIPNYEHYSHNPVIKVMNNEEFDLNHFRNVHVIDEREYDGKNKNLFFESSSIENADKLFYFPQMYKSKNALLNSISSISSKNTNNVKELTILDVNEEEMLTYYYALQNLPKYKINFSRIVIIYRNLRTTVFVEGGKKYYYWKRDAKEIYNKKRDKSSPIEFYYSFLRVYDSGLFWNKIFESPLKDVYLKNSKIIWGTRVIKYYLNLELILKDPAIRQIIKRGIIRTTGTTQGSTTFSNIDIVSKSLCLELNYDNDSFSSSYSHYIGSMFVTGKTESALHEENDAIKIYILKSKYFYDDTTVSSSKIHLFLWPDENLISKYIEYDSRSWERQNSTHVIKRGSKNSLSSVTQALKAHSTYQKNYSDTFEDMYYSFHNFIKFGHYRYHNNHDIISFDIISMLDFSYLKKHGMFKFILENCIQTLGSTAFENLKSSWIEELNIKLPINTEKGLIVYIDHFYNNHMISLIKKCFVNCDAEYLSNIISLEFIEEKKNNQPLIISELLYDFILQKINKFGGECSILFIDTMITTGLTERKVHQLLNKIAQDSGAEVNIKSFYLIDCQSMPYPSTRDDFLAYYRFDIPRMGNIGSCYLCKLLDDTRLYYTDFVSQLAKERIEEWNKIWGDRTPLTKADNSLLPKSRITNIEKVRNYIGIEHNFPYIYYDIFLVHVLEIIHSTMDLGLGLDIVNEEGVLDNEQALLLLAIECLLFKVDSHRRIYYQIVEKMIYLLSQYTISNNVTALVSIILLDCDDEILYSIYKGNYDHGVDLINNTDILILTSVKCKRNKNMAELDKNKYANYLYMRKMKELELYEEFHSQIYNTNGISHGTSFEKLLKPFGTVEKLMNGCDKVYNCLTYIANLINNINQLSFHSERVDSDTDKLLLDLRKEISETSKKMKNIKSDVKRNRQISLNDEQKDIVNHFVYQLKRVHSTLFINLGQNGSKGENIKDRIRSILDDFTETTLTQIESSVELNKTFEKEFSKQSASGVSVYYSKEKDSFFLIGLDSDSIYPVNEDIKKDEFWYVWDRRIEEEFQYLLTNVRHSCNLVEHDTFGSVNMIVNVHFYTKDMKIVMKSKSKESDKTIRDNIAKKMRHQRELVSNYGAITTYETAFNGQDYDLITTYMVSSVG